MGAKLLDLQAQVIESEPRLILQMQEPDEKAKLAKAEKLLKYASEYVQRHNLAKQEQEGMLAGQMHELVVQKLDRLMCA